MLQTYKAQKYIFKKCFSQKIPIYFLWTKNRRIFQKEKQLKKIIKPKLLWRLAKKVEENK